MYNHFSKIIIRSLMVGMLASCDSPSSMQLKMPSTGLLTLRGNITSALASGTRSVQISETDRLPAIFQTAKEINVIFDNNKSLIPAIRNLDGSITFPLTQGVQLDSAGNLSMILVADHTFSQSLHLQTGSLFQLAKPPIILSPANQIIKGSSVTLKANLIESNSADKYDFNWYFGASAAGPWTAVSSTGPEVSWEQPTVGNFYIRLDMISRTSQTSSTYVTPGPLFSVQESDQIASLQPASGNIFKGDSIQLKVHLPELKGVKADYLWSYSQSPQGPFQPMTGQGESITWEPPLTGAFYLRIQALANHKTSTYTSSKALVSVADSEELFGREPASGSLVRGESIRLTAALPGTDTSALSYAWFYGFSAQAAFIPIAGTGKTVSWLPPQTGEFLIRLRTFSPTTQESRTYTTSKAIVSVKDSDDMFITNPKPGNIQKGDQIELSLANATQESISWSFATTAQGPFIVIPATGSHIHWTPNGTGSYYIRAEVPDANGTQTFTSATPLVVVADRTNVITPQPNPGMIALGQVMSLTAALPQASGNLIYTWYSGASATGPWTAIQSLDDQASQRTISWIPTISGSYFVKVDVSNPDNQSMVSFISSSPLVFVNEEQPFFGTVPAPAKTIKEEPIELTVRFQPQGRTFNYGWQYSTSSAGPFLGMGGSNEPKLNWKPPKSLTGSFYIRFDATSPGTKRTISFVSKVPLVYISDSNAPSSNFGMNSPPPTTTR